ncbi:MAG: GAF domain-containing protein [Proteobacteria bacterium]|nr:GAF domain-containing protein [Pseudomonadota bacterium]
MQIIRKSGHQPIGNEILGGLDRIGHFKRHLRDNLDPLYESYQNELEIGKIDSAIYCLCVYGDLLYYLGTNLSKLEKKLSEYHRVIQPLEQETALHHLDVLRQTVQNLRNRTSDPCLLSVTAYNEEAASSLPGETTDDTGLGFLHCCKVQLCYLFGDLPQALEHIAMSEKYRDAVMGTFLAVESVFYNSLTALAVLPSTAESNRKKALKKVKTDLRKLKKWAELAPMNYRHKYLLVKAELAHATGRDNTALEGYDQAVEQARKNGYVQEEALANELAAKFWLDKGRDKIARAYMADARSLYSEWGAATKVRDLEEKYPQLFVDKRPRPESSGGGASSDWIPDADDFQDLDAVVKTTHVVSSENNLNRLLAKTMTIIVENAGARKGYLIKKTDDRTFIQALANLETKETKTPRAMPLDKCEDLCPAIVQQVISTGKDIVLHDASQEGDFTLDLYIDKNDVKSVLCTPFQYQGKRYGVLYLENDRVPHAFDEKRLEMIRVLLSQVAISIENAELFENRIKTEEKLRQSEEKFKLIVDQSDIGIVIAQDDSIKYINQAAAKVFEYTTEEIRSWPLGSYSRIVHPDDMPLVVGQARRHDVGEKDLFIENRWRAITKSNRRIWIRSYSKTVDFGGKSAVLAALTSFDEG